MFGIFRYFLFVGEKINFYQLSAHTNTHIYTARRREKPLALDLLLTKIKLNFLSSWNASNQSKWFFLFSLFFVQWHRKKKCRIEFCAAYATRTTLCSQVKLISVLFFFLPLRKKFGFSAHHFDTNSPTRTQTQRTHWRIRTMTMTERNGSFDGCPKSMEKWRKRDEIHNKLIRCEWQSKSATMLFDSDDSVTVSEQFSLTNRVANSQFFSKIGFKFFSFRFFSQQN